MSRRKSHLEGNKPSKKQKIREETKQQILKDSKEKLKGYAGKRIVIYCKKCGTKCLDLVPTEENLDLYGRDDIKNNYLCIVCRPVGMTLKDYFKKVLKIDPWWDNKKNKENKNVPCSNKTS